MRPPSPREAPSAAPGSRRGGSRAAPLRREQQERERQEEPPSALLADEHDVAGATQNREIPGEDCPAHSLASGFFRFASIAAIRASSWASGISRTSLCSIGLPFGPECSCLSVNSFRCLPRSPSAVFAP